MEKAQKGEEGKQVAEEAGSAAVRAVIENLKDDYRKATEAAVRKKRASYLAQALAWWLVPIALLYAFGWGIAWVRSGSGAGKHLSCDAKQGAARR